MQCCVASQLNKITSKKNICLKVIDAVIESSTRRGVTFKLKELMQCCVSSQLNKITSIRNISLKVIDAVIESSTSQTVGLQINHWHEMEEKLVYSIV